MNGCVLGTKSDYEFNYFTFLKDIFLCSIIAFGGPEFHYSILLERLVAKRNYFSETDFLECVALSTFLPKTKIA